MSIKFVRTSVGVVCGAIFMASFLTMWIGCAVREQRNPMHEPGRVQDSVASVCTITSDTTIHRLNCDDCPLDHAMLDRDVTPRPNICPDGVEGCEVLHRLHTDEAMKLLAESMARFVIGMGEEEAVRCIEIVNREYFPHGDEMLTYRLASRDGEHYALTCDYDVGRINLHIIHGIIVKAHVG